MSNGILGVIIGISIALPILLAVLAWAIKKKTQGDSVSVTSSIFIGILWLVSVAGFIGATVTLEARLGDEELAAAWVFGSIAVIGSLIGIAGAIIDD